LAISSFALIQIMFRFTPNILLIVCFVRMIRTFFLSRVKVVIFSPLTADKCLPKLHIIKDFTNFYYNPEVFKTIVVYVLPILNTQTFY